MTFSFDDITNLDGKVAIVTGSNTGIGLVTARELAKKGCHVIVASRTREKALAAIDSIKAVVPDASKLEFMPLDLMNLKSVYDFADAFKARNLPLHILINNAGVMVPPFQLSDDGIESQFATNHVTHHALTVALLPILEASAPSRIVVVSSNAHTMAPKPNGLDLDNLNNESLYSAWTWYGQSKIANIFFARELSRQLRERSVNNVYVNALHPGVVRTELVRHTFWLLRWIISWFQISADDGAKTQLYVATSNDVVKNDWHGMYFVPIAQLSETNATGKNAEEAKKLWAFTEALINEKVGNRN
ncbi:hypothetical protein LEN26_018166 [Aphanomyces euteiches]|nr:hypothetical protein LEN26_018166 [Aphanomyces euteiches]KAH9122228.1 hypothetical protein AeMF1_006379 [Aphanomyces euteiches]KAH9185684.1 hypothetical protein AeNC1_012341 [Aphanomyces euteiches]